jgi:hypothetical protein
MTEAGIPELGAMTSDAEVAAAVDLPMPHERRGVLRSEAAILLDRLLAMRARKRGAIDVAIGEYLRMMAIGDRTLTFGYAGIGDYARERLGLNARTAQKMAHLARELRARPLLREAVWSGEVTPRKAEAVLSVARGEAEKSWVSRARTDTVRALESAVKAAGRIPPQEDEPWELMGIPLPAEARPAVDKAMAVAGKVLGRTAPKWERIDAFFMEFLGAYGDEDEGSEAKFLHWALPASEELIERLQEELEKETDQWAFLDPVAPVIAPAMQEETDAARIDAELRRLIRERNHWDEEFGHLLMVFKSLVLWGDAGFASFGYYCVERLGMSVRTAEQRIALERRLRVLPPLRQAMRDGRISYEQARLVAWQATDETVTEWIERAEDTTCIALRREIEAKEEAQMRTSGWYEVRAPRHTVTLFAAVCRAAERVAGEKLTPGECFLWAVLHFLESHQPESAQRRTIHRRVLERDGWRCQVPGCSRAATHAHHIILRSQGGTDEEWNLISLCAVHHLRGIHGGYIRVSGRAPDGLVWELNRAALSRPCPAPFAGAAGPWPLAPLPATPARSPRA